MDSRRGWISSSGTGMASRSLLIGQALLGGSKQQGKPMRSCFSKERFVSCAQMDPKGKVHRMALRFSPAVSEGYQRLALPPIAVSAFLRLVYSFGDWQHETTRAANDKSR